MIQRIQTVYLIVAIILQVLLFYLPVYYISPLNNGPEEIPVVLSNVLAGTNVDLEATASDAISSQSTWLLVALALNALIIILALVAIFLYKKRTLQIKISNLGAFMAIILIGKIFFSAYDAAQVLADPEAEAMYDTSYAFGTWLPFISVVLFFLASRSIRKDEELVRSADRLR